MIENLSLSVLLLFVVISINADISSYRDMDALMLAKHRKRVEKLDVDMLLKNHRLVSMYMKCLLNEAACNKDGQMIKDVIPEILKTTCDICTDKEKEIVRKVMNFTYTNLRNEFDKLFDFYDPKRSDRDAMMKFMFNELPIVKEDEVKQSSENFTSAAPHS